MALHERTTKRLATATPSPVPTAARSTAGAASACRVGRPGCAAATTRGSVPGAASICRSAEDQGGLVAGVVIIGIGVFFLLAQVIPDIGRWIPLLIGLTFLAAFIPKREYGFLIPGCIVSGVGVGVILAGVVEDPWSGAAVLLSIAGGFIAIWVVSVLLRRVDRDWPRGSSRDAAQALWWPLIPGGILTLVGLIVLTEAGFESDLLRWWPLIIIAVGIVVLVSALRPRGGGRSR